MAPFSRKIFWTNFLISIRNFIFISFRLYLVIRSAQQTFNQLFGLDPSNKWGSGLRGAHGPEGEGNYLNVDEFRFWDTPEGKAYRQELDRKMAEFNQQASHDIKLTHIADWETDDDRYWNASWGFTFIPKGEVNE